MAFVSAPEDFLDPQTQAFYCRMLEALTEAQIPFLLGGAYAFGRYTGIERHTKDLDVFIHRRDYERTMQTLGRHGCRTELTFPHWLGKARCGDDFIDVIFSSGNAIAEVDDEWFEHAREGTVLGLPVKLCPPEEMIWSKAFIMERERFDGADINHLIRACGAEFDWSRLLRRFGPNWRVLLTHLVMFGFVYPGLRDQIPAWVLDDLLGRLWEEVHGTPLAARVCRGTLISRAQYLIDVERWGYEDARLVPGGSMTWREVARWTAAIGQDR
jgi:hypothetical protein